MRVIEMLCQICKEEEATVFFIEINQEEHHSVHLCENCAQQKHLQEVLNKSAKIIQKLWASLTHGESKEKPDAIVGACPHCGLTFAQFKKTGQLGCSVCYDHFWEILSPWLRQFHHLDQHDKALTNFRHQQQLPEGTRLKAALADAIARERYEEAATIRDQLRKLES